MCFSDVLWIINKINSRSSIQTLYLEWTYSFSNHVHPQHSRNAFFSNVVKNILFTCIIAWNLVLWNIVVNIIFCSTEQTNPERLYIPISFSFFKNENKYGTYFTNHFDAININIPNMVILTISFWIWIYMLFY